MATKTVQVTDEQRQTIDTIVEYLAKSHGVLVNGFAALKRDGMTLATISREVVRYRIERANPLWVGDMIDAELSNPKSAYRIGLSVANVGFYVGAYDLLAKAGVVIAPEDAPNDYAEAAYRVVSRHSQAAEAIIRRCKDGEDFLAVVSAETGVNVGATQGATKRRTPVETLSETLHKATGKEWSVSEARKLLKDVEALERKLQRVISKAPTDSHATRKSARAKVIATIA